ncbi:MAG TPA: hypothetical protein VFR56_08895 [Actinomycetes bacterium]|nr:hypothetical protein [Actinomycetes bacterium]
MTTTRRVLPVLLSTIAILAVPGAAAAAAAPAGPDLPPTHLDPARFSTTIDNPYLPLVPGTRMVYRERGDDGPGRIVVTVTRRTKTVQGVETVVVRDRAFIAGELVEDTRDWYAQDRRGNVWYFGENTKEYEDGKVVSTDGSWRAGRDGARAGIVMLARPRVGDSYYQEYAPGEALDQATVLRLDASRTVPYGTVDDLLVTRDFTELEPDLVERKFYAPGVGVVLEKLVRGGRERVVLLRVTHV